MRFIGVDALKAIFSKLTSSFPTIWTWVSGSYKHALTTSAAVLGIIFVVFFLFSFGTSPEPTAGDIAKAWHESIRRLGIYSVYPPEEDFHVGDVLAIIIGKDDTPLRGYSVRIGHIDFRAEILTNLNRPIFSETAEVKLSDKETYRRQDSRETKLSLDDRILPTLVAFPGVTISRAAKSTGWVRGNLGIFSADRDSNLIEEIRIPVAETYGVPAYEAYVRFHAWCTAPNTKEYCTEPFVRRLLAFTIGAEVNEMKAGKYVYEMGLRLVTRVFLMRQIQQRRIRKDQRDAEASAPTNPTPEDGQDSNGRTGAKARIAQSDSTELGLQDVFQRPLVFGYRSLTLSTMTVSPEDGQP